MKITLHTKTEHEYALNIVKDWMKCNSINPRKMPAKFDALVDAIVEYEKIHYPI